jgi:hypothetical protein
MGGQGCFKHARETRGRMRLNEYKKRSLKAMEGKSVFVETVIICVDIRACKNM